MPFLFLSPSTQYFNPYITTGDERYWMNALADEMMPYLHASGITVTRNDPDGSAAQSIRDSNASRQDFHLALHSNAAPQAPAAAPGQETAPAQAEKPRMTDFKPYVGRKRRSGTGCVTEINDHLFEGRYSPKWPDGKKHARNVYAHTREECEEKLKALIAEMNEERKNLKDRLAGIAPPEKLTKKQRKLWDYMRLHPEVTEFSTIAKRTGLARNTVKKHYGMVAAMLGRK